MQFRLLFLCLYTFSVVKVASMRLVIQRVKSASVTVGGEKISSIRQGEAKKGV
jgi:hypothetical protein